MKADWSYKALRVNLTNSTTSVEDYPKNWIRQYMGGRAFGAYHLLKEVPAGADPLGPENILIFATGVLAQCKLSGASRYSVLAKSPLTGGYGEAEAGGWFAPELSAAGFNAIIFEGQAESPVYLWIKNGEAEIRDASEIWGLGNKQAYKYLREDLGKVRVSQIGPAGENLVKFAHIVNELRHAHGRSGMGAVMGSKKLKAVVVSGSAPPQIADQEAFDRLRKWHNQFLLESFFGKYFRERGTTSGVEYQNVMGGLPTRNFQDMTFEEVAKISSQVLMDNYSKGHGTCYGCVLRCKPVSHIKGDEIADPVMGGPEYETLGALGSMCGVSDLGAVVRGNALANDYGLDSISLGSTIAFAMECYDKGLITKEDTDGIALKFGNADALLEMTRRIAYREGFGDLLAEGVKHASQVIGKGSEAFAMHVKGQDFPMHDPRGKFSQALAYAICPTGADHNTSSFDNTYAKKGAMLDYAAPLGIYQTVPEYDLGPEKVRLYLYLHHEKSLFNSLLLCNFVTEPMTPLTLTKVAEVVQAVTGWDVSGWELMKVGERGTTLARLFNLKHGFTAEDDRLPPRMFEPVKAGPKNGKVIDPQEIQTAIETYYAMMGWDSSGVPTPTKLVELGLSEFIPTST